MPDGWRSRILAPVYALVVAFVLASVLGFVLRPGPTPTTLDGSDPTQGPDTGSQASTVIAFVIDGDGDEAGLRGVRVEIETDTGSADTGRLDGSGRVEVPAAVTKVCAELPDGEGWFPLGEAERDGEDICLLTPDGASGSVTVIVGQGSESP